MRIFLAAVAALLICDAAAEASIIHFEGSNNATPSGDVSFYGQIDTVTNQASATISYFFGDFTFPPVFGTETVTGVGSFYAAGRLVGYDEPYLTIDIVGTNRFDLSLSVANSSASVSGPTIPLAFGFQVAHYDDSIANVPLPETAPMFGAGLLALGAFGYLLKRTKAAAA